MRVRRDAYWLKLNHIDMSEDGFQDKTLKGPKKTGRQAARKEIKDQLEDEETEE